MSHIWIFEHSYARCDDESSYFNRGRHIREGLNGSCGKRFGRNYRIDHGMGHGIVLVQDEKFAKKDCCMLTLL